MSVLSPQPVAQDFFFAPKRFFSIKPLAKRQALVRRVLLLTKEL